MAQFSEVDRIEAALQNHSAKELAWSLWYCRMRQAIPSARPADVRYWSAMEARVDAALAPPSAARQYPTKKKRANRGLGSGAADPDPDSDSDSDSDSHDPASPGPA